jgi:hypothetical protein
MDLVNLVNFNSFTDVCKLNRLPVCMGLDGLTIKDLYLQSMAYDDKNYKHYQYSCGYALKITIFFC